jgi:hypothetical protein
MSPETVSLPPNQAGSPADAPTAPTTGTAYSRRGLAPGAVELDESDRRRLVTPWGLDPQ